ncbi:MAG: membrane protein insertion efficiency factor YidD [Calditrichaeota bacterium]|nr:membrane protein insertion efficiency factor YidD [Candidatus Cloacimonadota bacterium]MCA9785496.1 membrane protein insertion efficiency factor YidD [Candidatus Cloacimonadota bacterium]MCB1047109.1 membrane protein insertion efficiency factor YidD [Calditrichota bacterium]MCB9474860.1 membrane protein insertion efficiency factor YidD [Candidatus Delongbacteria bacterium]
MKWLAVGVIRTYQRFVSPLLAPRCRYYPSCSQYAVEAFGKYSFFKALAKSCWRLLRCNPWSDGGVDHP